MDLPLVPPFAIRARLLSPLAAGGTLHEPDGLVVVDGAGRLTYAGPASDAAPHERAAAADLRPWVVMPGMVDLHAHLPQLPNAGIGFALDLLTWLERVTFPTERSWADPAVAQRLAPPIFEAFAAAGTTTVLAYGVVYEAAMDAAFQAAEAHGIRAILGKVMMDRGTYDPTIESSAILERSLRESADLIGRWHGADGGRLGYAVTPRFAVSCTAEMLRESADLARSTGTWWQSHVAEDPFEIAEVRRLFPDALDYVDVYDRAGALGEKTILAHAIHLSDREVARLAETGSHVAHCPASNLFIGAGIMPLSSWLEGGLTVGLGSDVSGGPDASLFSVMRIGAYAQLARRSFRGENGIQPGAPSGGDPSDGARSGVGPSGGAPNGSASSDGVALDPFGWLRLATLDGARALGLGDVIGSLETGKEADLIAIDPSYLAPLAGQAADEDPADLASRLIFRAHPDMVRAAWVRGRRLAGPGVRG